MPFHQQLYNAMELVTGFNAMLTTGRFLHCAGKFVGFQTDVAQTWS
jgi:hypothetical protein